MVLTVNNVGFSDIQSLYYTGVDFKSSATGKAGWAAPRLKDADLSLDKLREGYVEVSLMVLDFYS